MIIKKLKLRSYRNYEQMQTEFEQGIHLITGRNGQGKTNLLESIFYLSTTRSHRTSDDQDLIKEDKDAFMMDALICKNEKKMDFKINVNEKGKNLFIYHTPIKKVSDFIGEFNAVMFCPDDMTLFNASPKIRRRFIDMELGKISKLYMKTLNLAQKLLRERNSYLKQNEIDKNYISVLTSQLIEQEIIIVRQRYKFLEDLLKHCDPFYEELSKDDTKLSYDYISCIPYDEDIDIMRQQLALKYEKSLERDLFLKQTTVGTHKEDFMFKVNDKEIASYASQGQKRCVLLSMKIGIVYLIYDLIHDYPVLLLDDVFSELDEIRREKLLVSLPPEVQIFISTTETVHLPRIEGRTYYSWMVNHGTLTRLQGGIQ